MRSQLPTLELDAVFEAKEDLALAVKNQLSETMSAFGYQILQTLITDLDPDQRVKNAMNEINSSKRLKFAVAERAEGDKILQVKSAEAEAEAKYLSGVGVAKQRKAIVDGLKSSIVDFADGVKGSSTKEVMDLLLLTQVGTVHAYALRRFVRQEAAHVCGSIPALYNYYWACYLDCYLACLHHANIVFVHLVL